MKKVLVADDTKNIRELLQRCLRLEGYEVKTACDGNEAVKMFLQEPFDLAFLDIKMPFYSGTEVLKKIREMGVKTPVIIITAYATIKNTFECTYMGAVAYLQKPFTPEKVRNVLSNLNNELKDQEQDYLSEAKKMLNDGLFIEAFSLLRNSLTQKPLDAQIYFLLSKVCESLGNFEDARKYFKIYEAIRDNSK